MRHTLYIIILAITAVSCTHQQPTDGRQLTVSIEPLRFLTEEIAGDSFTVTTLVPEGLSPETYEPTVQQMASLASSTLLIKVGEIGFERTWMNRLCANAPHTTVVNASEGIRPIKTAGGNDDPHTWMSARNARQMAHNIRRALTAAYPEDSLGFSRRTESLVAKIDSTDRKVRSLLEKCGTRAFLIYHPILTYYADEYGLRQIPVEEEGREPSAAQTEQTVKTARQQGVKVLFLQKQFSESSVRAVGKAVGAAETGINPLSYDWCGEMTGIAEKLK